MTKLVSKDKSAKGLYKQTKADLMSAVYKPGERIVIDRLAERLRVSSTPVREMLNRLAAEELVVVVPQMGFFMPLLTETDLRNLYSMQQIFLNWSLQDLALSHAEDGVDRFLKLPFDVNKLKADQAVSAQRLGELISAFFLHMIRLSGNNEVTHKAENLNDRLGPVRSRENEVTNNVKSELLGFFDAYILRDFVILQNLVDRYFISRIALVPALMCISDDC